MKNAEGKFILLSPALLTAEVFDTHEEAKARQAMFPDHSIYFLGSATRAGDYVKCLVSEFDVRKGSIYRVHSRGSGSIEVIDNVGDIYTLLKNEFQEI